MNDMCGIRSELKRVQAEENMGFTERYSWHF